MARCLQVLCRRLLRERGCSFLTLFVDVSVPILGTGVSLAFHVGRHTSTRLTPPPDRRTIDADHRPDGVRDQLQLCSLPARIVPLAAGFF
jgi:hypothetical protein